MLITVIDRYLSRDTNPLPSALPYPRFALHSSDIGSNVRNIIRGDTGDRFHVAKLPVMRSHPIFCRELKRDVAMMGRLIHAMQKWRPLVAAFQINAVARSTVLCVQSLARCGIRHQTRTWHGKLHRLGGCRKAANPKKASRAAGPTRCAIISFMTGSP